MKTVLLDQTIFSATRVFEQRSIPVSSPLTGQPMGNHLAGLVVIKQRPRVEKERGPIVALGRAAVSGLVELRASRFSFDEGFRVCRYPDLPAYLDIFGCLGVPYPTWAHPHLAVTNILDIGDEMQGANPTKQAAAYKRKLGRLTDIKFMKDTIQKAARLGCSDADMTHLKALAAVTAKLGESSVHIVDVLQLWTAHVHQIPYFATLDKKFVRFMQESIKNPWQSRPILPSDLCAEWGLPVEPFGPVDQEEFYTLADDPLTELLR